MNIKKISKEQPENFEFNSSSLEAAKTIVSKYLHYLNNANLIIKRLAFYFKIKASPL